MQEYSYKYTIHMYVHVHVYVSVCMCMCVLQPSEWALNELYQAIDSLWVILHPGGQIGRPSGQGN